MYIGRSIKTIAIINVRKKDAMFPNPMNHSPT